MAGPQGAFWANKWRIPGTTWTLRGHSRALERTGFWIAEAQVCLDCGVDLPSPETPAPRVLLVTHSHIDHANALPMMFRHDRPEAAGPMHVFTPREVAGRMCQYAQLSWAMKADWGAPLAERYAAPTADMLAAMASAATGDTVADASGGSRFRVWRPVDTTSSAGPSPPEGVPVVVGRKAASGVGTKIIIHAVKCFHTVSTAGYVLSERRNKLRPDLMVEGDKKATGAAVKAAKARGETTTVESDVRRLAFLCDTTTEVLEADAETAALIASCPVVMIECTYLGADMDAEAAKRGHIGWLGYRGLSDYVRRSPDDQTWVLIHFSLRYSDNDILEFFSDTASCGDAFTRSPPADDAKRPPRVVLWLDSGVVELWVAPRGEATAGGDSAAGGAGGTGQGEVGAACSDSK